MKQNKDYEIDFFDSLAKTDHYETTTNEYYEYVDALIRDNNIPMKGKMLEAGCGCGVVGKSLMKSYHALEVVGIDISPEMINRANCDSLMYTPVLGDLESSCMFNENYFSLILCPFILHHFPDINLVLSNFEKWIAKNGYLIILEPNGTNIINKISKFVRRALEVIMGEQITIKKGWATPNETDHSVGTYRKLLRKYDFEIICIDSKYFPPPREKGISMAGVREACYRMYYYLFSRHFFAGPNILIFARKI